MSSDAISADVVCDETPHFCCSIVPPFLLSRIADHPEAPSGARTWARNSLLHTRTLVQHRHAFISRQMNASHGSSHGIVPGHMLRYQGQQAKFTSATPKRLNRTVYSSNNSEILDHLLIRSEGSSSANDTAVNECYDGFGATFKLFSEIFDRNSINDAGMTLNGSVHYGRSYANAFWNGSQMVFGDGDGSYFNRFTASLDVIGHELTHGVTQFTCNLEYKRESGALNESMSDVFGSMVKQYHLNQTAAQADWLIGAELLTSRVHGVALRSMKAPGTAFNDRVLGKDPQPSHYSQVLAHPYSDDDDEGGVHIYSGVPNRAFYLIATNLGGYSWDRAGKIWYAALKDNRLKATFNFKQFAALTCQIAESLFDSSVKAVVEKAWSDVGLGSGSGGGGGGGSSPFDGTWVGQRSNCPLECVFKTSGTHLEGLATLKASGRTMLFTMANGFADHGGAIRFTADFKDANTSNEKYFGSLSGGVISGQWENVDKQAYLDIGWGDTTILGGSFRLTRK